jgi:glycosyltransferase involved in cell wall biosynthesis
VPVSALIIEVNGGGHRFRYVSHLIQFDPTARLLTTREAFQGADFDVYLGGSAAQISLINTDSPLRVARAAFDLAEEHNCDVVAFPDGDRYLTAIARLLLLRSQRPPRVHLLLMRARPADRRASTLIKFGGKALITLFVSCFKSIHVHLLIDAFGVTRPSPLLRGTPLADPVDITVRHPFDRDAPAPDRIPQPFVVGIFGVITERKNPALLLDAATEHQDVEVLLAGQMDAETRQSLLRIPSWTALERGHRLRVLQGYLTTEKLIVAMDTTDAVAILHENNAPSGIMAEAVAAGRPVLVPAGGVLAQVANQLGVGISTKLTPKALSSAIDQMKRNVPQYDAAIVRAQQLLAWRGFAAALLA